MDEIQHIANIGIEVIQSRIYEIRGLKVMIDHDLAQLYQVDTRSLKQAVRRNLDRFPADFLLRLSNEEAKKLIDMRVSQNVIPQGYNLGGSDMFAFTEHGVLALSFILRSAVAKQMGIIIVRAFVALRKALAEIDTTNQRLENLKLEMANQRQYIESILHDQNDINEDIQMQLDAISQSLADLQNVVDTPTQGHRVVISGFKQKE